LKQQPHATSNETGALPGKTRRESDDCGEVAEVAGKIEPRQGWKLMGNWTFGDLFKHFSLNVLMNGSSKRFHGLLSTWKAFSILSWPKGC